MQIIEISEPNANDSAEFENELAVGIDFGTTNSLIAISRNKQVKFIHDERAREIIPSIIEWDDVGQFYIASGLAENKNSINSIKRLLGKSSAEISANPQLYKSVEDLIDLTDDVPRLKINNRQVSLPEVAAEIFKYLKGQAERELNAEITKAVVTVPAYFDEGAKGAVMLAAKIAGLQVLRLIAEPTAAAYAYGLNKDNSGCYLVYDLGGGTFDVSVLNMQAGILQVIATGGDNMLGGDDIDYALAEYLQQNYQLQATKSLEIAKIAKETLTCSETFTLASHSINLDISTFERVISPLIEKTMRVTQDTLEQAGNIMLDGIILVGGSSRIPLIAKSLKGNYNASIFNDVDPDRVVAAGAALQAENLTTSNLNSLLIDVIPLSVGLELYGGLVEKIILRNSAIPLSVTKEFTTHADKQTAMQFHILQGEREEVRHCRSLAKFELKTIPPMKAGTARVEVTFSIDADGILSVSAQEKITGKSQIIEIKPSYGLSSDEIDEILKQAFKNAASDHENRLLQETILSAKSLIYNIENAIKEMPDILPANEVDKIKQAITDLDKTFAGNMRDIISEKSHLLEKKTEKFVEARLNFAAAELFKGKKID
jgi:molecular chaperone HscA